MRLLMAAPWKGNVRELDNALERAVILAEGTVLTAEDFQAEIVAGSEESACDDLEAALAHQERLQLRRVLARCGNDKREAARRLGLGLSTLYRKLEEHGLRTGP